MKLSTSNSVEAQSAFSRSFPPTQEGIASASDYLDEVLESRPGPGGAGGASPALHVILDEICSNIVKHSGASGFDVGIEIVANPPCIRMTFMDDGVAYDPLDHADPDTTLPAADRPIGGLGLLMVKKMASSVSYRRADNRNVLVVERAVAGI